jgi:uncharacterized membrane protein
MNYFIEFLFIFEFCSTVGWILEFIYRSIVEKELKNPGFLSGCSLPIYGIGGLALYIMCLTLNTISQPVMRVLAVFIVGSVIMTLIEFIGGIITMDIFHMRLWDYTDEKWNYKGLICPKFSLCWGLCCIGFYFLIYPWLYILVEKVFSEYFWILAIGFYFGIFVTDLFGSLNLANTIKAYTKEIKQIVSFENLKSSAQENLKKYKNKNPNKIIYMQNIILRGYLLELKNNTIKKAEELREKAEEIKEKGEKLKEDAGEKLHIRK